ncbi:MAG TPA: [acyl-carrier-protein] S-malonyltransferase [Elusimicrobia bacterium]|nr:MAG: [acyl-carrier-protein] S-malonyltransferase [Elusimicrobia bacterium RIFOXYA12_FULL_49_49]OGS15988.1 MAG: [acyl-carrier-protein] S-malonyltransferase [Elusimicrobia bacterium RIFOXYA2_FULL_47_53]OGS26332.1 MAG: [acyl-carrier-protein] S-malonyltransferase [Elusimicrobia bacterium RIFOXYB12_FULL_50_12]OGS29156.1 MAG: [acyl-carrier-protein] S-malonyltransferase [Elusimicrobia bacterium RIFOXYB2_FULL_46_23]HBU69373.1 [acyl-carrier-protein] S-malonyltransferase [Elusimicrobiota bacterium]
MTKIALVFPGQGAQAVGMAKELYDNFSQAKQVFDSANDVLGFDLKKIVFEGPEETLRQTQYTQPAIFAASMAAFNVFAGSFNISDAAAAGHSLGEYSAMAAAGVFNLNDGFKLVKARGEFIQAASQKNPGTMAAIIGLDNGKINEICKNSGGVCEAVNFNSPGQIVIAGASEAVSKTVALATEAGAAKAIVLNVSGPFHSSLMTPAADMMGEELRKYNFNNPKFPVYTNCDAKANSDASAIAGKLVRQINNPVLWEQIIRNMISEGYSVFIEIGPGRVLSGLLRRIDKGVKSLNIEDSKSLEKTIAELSKN